MPRFTLKSMLLIFAVVAIWLSAFVAYPANYGVRYAIVLLTTVAAGLKAYCSRGRQKCFWLGFAVVLFMAAFTEGILGPNLRWLDQSVRPFFTSVNIYGNRQMPGPGEQKVEFVSETIKFGVALILAALAGLMGMDIYDQGSTPNEQ